MHFQYHEQNFYFRFMFMSVYFVTFIYVFVSFGLVLLRFGFIFYYKLFGLFY
jgi:hypothetical protein